MSFSTSTSESAPARGRARYFVAAALSGGLLLAATAAINWWIDPFNKLGNNWLGVHGVSERDAKPIMFGDGAAWRGVLLGSSKTTYIDPHDLVCPRVFNASFPGAVPEEMLAFVEAYVHDQAFALIGLDFYMINESAAPWRPEGLETDPSLADLAEYLLGGRVLLASLRDLRLHFQDQPPRLAPAGNRIADRQVARHARMAAPDYATTLKMLESRHFADVEYSARRLEVLARLRRVLEDRGIQPIVFFNPLNEQVLALLERLPARAAFARFRRDIRRIFPDLVDLSRGRWSDSAHYFRYDPYHYLPAPGAAFLNRDVLAAGCPTGAGRTRPPAATSPGGVAAHPATG